MYSPKDPIRTRERFDLHSKDEKEQFKALEIGRGRATISNLRSWIPALRLSFAVVIVLAGFYVDARSESPPQPEGTGVEVLLERITNLNREYRAMTLTNTLFMEAALFDRDSFQGRSLNVDSELDSREITLNPPGSDAKEVGETIGIGERPNSLQAFSTDLEEMEAEIRKWEKMLQAEDKNKE